MDRVIEVGARCVVMGILNVTPDSFFDGGRNINIDAAVGAARQMVEDGADIVDIGGESTRPGAAAVDTVEELRRVIPVIEQITTQLTVPVSIDTRKASVAEAALGAGAIIVNDVSAMSHDPSMVDVVRGASAGVVLMHMQGDPKTMQTDPHYKDVVAEVQGWLAQRARWAENRGISPGSIVIDPGIGFGKTLEHNLALIRSVKRFKQEGFPVLVGPSRKRFIGAVLGLEADERLEGTAATVSLLVEQGVDIVRVHDVKEMVRVARMTEALRGPLASGDGLSL
ncbi:MAG: dihydropteroate synthase [Actinomycetota bacterium]